MDLCSSLQSLSPLFAIYSIRFEKTEKHRAFAQPRPTGRETQYLSAKGLVKSIRNRFKKYECLSFGEQSIANAQVCDPLVDKHVKVEIPTFKSASRILLRHRPDHGLALLLIFGKRGFQDLFGISGYHTPCLFIFRRALFNQGEQFEKPGNRDRANH